MDESDVRGKKAVHAKHRRNGHLGELRTRRNYVQDLISSPSMQVAEVESGITRYEEAFRNFVASHDNSPSFEADEEKKQLIIDSYDNEQELKFTLEILVNQWRVERNRDQTSPSECSLSVKSAKSCSSTTSSIKKKRMLEEAKIEMQALKEKQQLHRELEEVEKGKTELSRKMELLNAKNKMKYAEIDLSMEQSEEVGEKDGMNKYLMNHYAQLQDPLPKEHLSQPIKGSTTPITEPQLNVSRNDEMPTSSQLGFTQSSLPSNYVEPKSTAASFVSRVVTVAKGEASSGGLTTLTSSHCTESSAPIGSIPQFNASKTTTVTATTSQPSKVIYNLSSSPMLGKRLPRQSSKGQPYRKLS